MLTFWPPALADGALDAWAKMVTEPELLSSTVEAVTGASARTFREWVILQLTGAP